MLTSPQLAESFASAISSEATSESCFSFVSDETSARLWWAHHLRWGLG